MKHQDALAQLAGETARARNALALERAVRAGFWLALAVSVWAALALAGLHEQLPLLAQSLTALAALGLFALLAWRARRAWSAPSEAEARARLAADCRLDAGAFETLRDQPTRYDGLSMALWSRARESAIDKALGARAGAARVRLNDLDRFRLRYLVVAALLISAVVAGEQGPDRLARAFAPDPGPLLGDQAMSVEAWVTPADYTHAAPISLSDHIGERVATPPSVEATVRVTGPTGAPRLVFNTSSVRFTRAADGAWEAHMRIASAGRLKIVRFHTRAAWAIAAAPDGAPRAAFTAPITLLPDERASLAWRAGDDFGVRRLVLRVRPLHPPAGLARADAIDSELEAPAGDPRETEAETEIDLAAHAYAGMEVEARIVAFDGIGQEGVSEALRLTLPERVFLQPLARAAIEIRRQVLAERRPYRRDTRRAANSAIIIANQRALLREDRPPLNRAPAGIARAVRLVDALTMAPQDGYFRDLAIYLGLRLARAELGSALNIDETEIAAETLWRTALRAEYGGAGDTRAALDEAQRLLAEALTSGAPQQRIAQLLEALRRASESYVQALTQEALRNNERHNSEDTAEQTQINSQDIEELLREVQRLSEQGRTAEAQQMLQMLASILENLNVQLGENQSGGQNESQEQMQESMDGLSQAMGEQRALNDATRQQMQSGNAGGGDQEGGQGGGELAERQAQTRQGLAAAQRMADEAGAAPSQDLNAAGQAMGRAENALRRDDLEGAEAAQGAALESLRQGAESLGAEMRARARGDNAQQGPSGGRDPLGREISGAGAGTDGGEGAVSGQSNPARTREIFDAILNRAQDPNRPEAEREYLRRLLDRFGES